MIFLVVGLGSMGKRRIRCLQALNYQEIIGFDKSEERRRESESLYGVQTVSRLNEIDLAKVDACIISTPPDCHLEYINLAIENGIPVFVEASVILDGLAEANVRAMSQAVVVAPSCTLRFHPAINIIKDIVHSGEYGRFTNFSYHSGQYLPDWHPWEKVSDFYVSNPATGGGREIVPFELTWLVDVFGFPQKIYGLYGKTMDVGADIDDTYALTMQFGQGFGALLVDVVSRHAVRSMTINFERGQVVWNWEEQIVKVYDAQSEKWINRTFSLGKAAGGYNKNIAEQMYIDELQSFIKATLGKGSFPNNLDEDIRVLELLEQAEQCNV